MKYVRWFLIGIGAITVVGTVLSNLVLAAVVALTVGVAGATVALKSGQARKMLNR